MTKTKWLTKDSFGDWTDDKSFEFCGSEFESFFDVSAAKHVRVCASKRPSKFSVEVETRRMVFLVDGEEVTLTWPESRWVLGCLDRGERYFDVEVE